MNSALHRHTVRGHGEGGAVLIEHTVLQMDELLQGLKILHLAQDFQRFQDAVDLVRQPHRHIVFDGVEHLLLELRFVLQASMLGKEASAEVNQLAALHKFLTEQPLQHLALPEPIGRLGLRAFLRLDGRLVLFHRKLLSVGLLLYHSFLGLKERAPGDCRGCFFPGV